MTQTIAFQEGRWDWRAKGIGRNALLAGTACADELAMRSTDSTMRRTPGTATGNDQGEKKMVHRGDLIVELLR